MGKWLFGAMGPEPAFAAAGVGSSAPREEKEHNWHLAGGSRTAYTRQPSRGPGSSRSPRTGKKGITRRAIIALILLVLLPPVGIAFMWQRGIFQLRGRVLLTVISTIIMTVMFSFMMPQNEVIEVQPPAVKASLRSPLPTDAALNALSNMEQLLAGVENVPVVNSDLNEVTGLTSAESAVTEAPSDPLQEVVYCVTVDAVYYHKEDECKGQVNRRSLTVGQALTEGLQPCKRCDPPAP